MWFAGAGRLVYLPSRKTSVRPLALLISSLANLVSAPPLPCPLPFPKTKPASSDRCCDLRSRLHHWLPHAPGTHLYGAGSQPLPRLANYVLMATLLLNERQRKSKRGRFNICACMPNEAQHIGNSFVTWLYILCRLGRVEYLDTGRVRIPLPRTAPGSLLEVGCLYSPSCREHAFPETGLPVYGVLGNCGGMLDRGTLCSYCPYRLSSNSREPDSSISLLFL